MRTRIGKIARLPKQIREQLNNRLENGESGTTLIQWLNQLPEVQKIITEQFGGHAIRAQNLSQWRNGGYLDWTRHQLLREQTRWTAEQALDLNSDTGDTTISIAENVAMIMSAELAIHVQALTAIKNPKKRFHQFRLLSRELSRIRRDDQRTIRTEMHREQQNSTLEPALRPSTLDPSQQPEPVEKDGACEQKPEAASQTSDLRLPTSAEPTPRLEPPAPDSSGDSDHESPLIPETAPLTISEQISVNSCGPLELSTLNPQPSTSPPSIPLNPTKAQYKVSHIPIRGRRFTCIEG